MIFAGVDWAEAHHDVCVMAEDGQVLGQRRVGHSVAGVGELHALIGAHAADGEPVAVGIEIDRGLVVTALLAAGYQVFAVNPLASARYNRWTGIPAHLPRPRTPLRREHRLDPPPSRRSLTASSRGVSRLPA